jgi:hypothetical protein
MSAFKLSAAERAMILSLRAQAARAQAPVAPAPIAPEPVRETPSWIVARKSVGICYPELFNTKTHFAVLTSTGNMYMKPYKISKDAKCIPCDRPSDKLATALRAKYGTR